MAASPKNGKNTNIRWRNRRFNSHQPIQILNRMNPQKNRRRRILPAHLARKNEPELCSRTGVAPVSNFKNFRLSGFQVA